jgi:hypothetical protein
VSWARLAIGNGDRLHVIASCAARPVRFPEEADRSIRLAAAVAADVNIQGDTSTSALNRFMSRGFVAPQVHAVLDYPPAAILIAGPLVLDFDYKAATVIALVFGGGAAVLAVATAWTTGIVKISPFTATPTRTGCCAAGPVLFP